MTKRDVINAMLNDVNVNGNADYVAYLENELSLLDKKAASAKKSAAKKKAAGDALKDTILNALTADPTPIATIADTVGASKAKVTARLTSLVKDGKATKSVIKVDKKPVTVYSVA